MAGGINLAFAADVRSFLTGTKDAERALERVDDSLDDVARGGKDAGEKLERTFRDSFDGIRRDAKTKTDDIADTTRRNMDRAGDASGDFKREAIANVSETASSFDGSMDDIASMVQGTLGGLADLPGVGLGAAALGALGGVVYSMWKNSSEDMSEAVQTAFDAMLESGQNYITQTQIQDALKTLYDDDGKMDQVRSAAENLGLSVEAVATAYVTAGGARDAVQQGAMDRIAEEQAAIDALREADGFRERDTRGRANRQVQAHQDVIDSYQGIINMIDGQGDATDEAATKAEEFRRANALAQANVRGEYEQTADTQGRTTQQAIDDMRRLATAINGTPQRVPVTLDLADAERQLRTWRPVIVGQLRAGQGIV